jgi:hypothetical protein
MANLGHEHIFMTMLASVVNLNFLKLLYIKLKLLYFKWCKYSYFNYTCLPTNWENIDATVDDPMIDDPPDPTPKPMIDNFDLW